MAFAELGLTDKEFFALPPFRTYLMQLRYHREIERRWEQTRRIVAEIHNSAPGRRNPITPRQVIKLPFDRVAQYSEWTQEDALDLIRKWGGSNK